MPLRERANLLEYCRKKGELDDDSYYYLTRTYYELGDLEKATATIRSALEEYNESAPLLIIYAMLLEESNLESSTLKEIYVNLGNYSYPDSYPGVLMGSYYNKFTLWNHAYDYFIKNFTVGPKNNIILKSHIQEVATNSLA